MSTQDEFFSNSGAIYILFLVRLCLLKKAFEQSDQYAQKYNNDCSQCFFQPLRVILKGKMTPPH